MLVIINCILALIFLFVLDKVKSSQNIVNFKDNRDEKATENPLTFEPLLSLIISATGEKYKIYIPEGSITIEFSVDME